MFDSKEYCRKNAEKANARAKKWYQDNHSRALTYYADKRKDEGYRQKMKDYLKDYYQKNKENILAQNREYRARTGYLELKAKAHRRSMLNNPNYRMAHILRGRVQAAIKFRRGQKATKTTELIGCSIEVARQHIESQFKEGMTWQNHGMYTWHIDHIIPLETFDLTTIEGQKKAFHYTNLQPLFALENLSKGSKHSDDIGRPYGKP